MSDEATPSAPASDRLDIFDRLPQGQLACRVCGALVPGEAYAGIHWDWHEAANGA